MGNLLKHADSGDELANTVLGTDSEFSTSTSNKYILRILHCMYDSIDFYF